MELWDEILELLKRQQSPIANHFEDNHFVISLGYLADFFSLLNDLKTSVQGKDVDIIQARGKVVAFTGKLPIRSHRFESGNLEKRSHL